MNGEPWICPDCESKNEEQSSVCVVCGCARPTKATEVIPPRPQTVSEPENRKKRSMPWGLLLSLGILLLLTPKLLSLRQTVETQKGDLAALESALYERESDLSQTQEKLNEQCAALEVLDGTLPGYADNYFHADQGVIVLHPGDVRTLTLTTALRGSFTIYFDRIGSAAAMTFDEETWKNSTTLTVCALEEGTSCFTFTSSNYDKSFCVLVVVE